MWNIYVSCGYRLSLLNCYLWRHTKTAPVLLRSIQSLNRRSYLLFLPGEQVGKCSTVTVLVISMAFFRGGFYQHRATSSFAILKKRQQPFPSFDSMFRVLFEIEFQMYSRSRANRFWVLLDVDRQRGYTEQITGEYERRQNMCLSIPVAAVTIVYHTNSSSIQCETKLINLIMNTTQRSSIQSAPTHFHLYCSGLPVFLW